MKKFEILKEIIEQHKSFLLTTHVNPDADALGSELALHEILLLLDKKVRVVNHSATPYNLEFLDEKKVIEKYDSEIHKNIFNEADVLIVLDLNQANRVVKMEKGLTEFTGIKICIDHHKDPENFVNHFIGGDEYSATGEIIYDFLEQAKLVKMDKRIAEMIYVAVMTDTGSFRFERTSPKIHKLAADLLSYGVNPTAIYDKVYDQFRVGRIKLLGETLSSIELHADGKIAVMKVTREALEKNNSSEADVDGFVNYCLSIQNVLIGILIYELKDGIKISFRSKGNIPVNKLAHEFNGGGHSNAAGAKILNTGIEEAKKKILKSAINYL
ncbi:MAG: bifunctional oligoribonuclease/PAP phosphatase NrnA [Bacteroidota bacterium]